MEMFEESGRQPGSKTMSVFLFLQDERDAGVCIAKALSASKHRHTALSCMRRSQLDLGLNLFLLGTAMSWVLVASPTTAYTHAHGDVWRRLAIFLLSKQPL
jgi:hypothetical protein